LTSSLNANLFSQENTVCANVPLPMGFIFSVDFGDPSVTPRPGTWLPDVLRAFVTFNPAGGGVSNVIVNSVGPGTPDPGKRGVLVPSFSNTISFTPAGLGSLFVYLSIYDPSSGVVAIYVDTLPVVFCPTPPKPKPSSPGIPTGFWVTPDPSSPSGYRR